MKNKIFKGNQLENIITRFYFKQKELCFQIILQLKHTRIVYNEYNDYHQYKMQLAQLISAKQSNQDIFLNNKTNNDVNLLKAA